MPVATGSLGTPRLAIAAAFGVQGLLFISLTTRLPVLADLFDFDELALSGLMLMMVLLAGVGSSLAGRLQMLDARTMEWTEIRMARQPGCAVCGAR